jgi:hypothetical protein
MVDDTFVNENNLFRLLDMLESVYNPYDQQITMGQIFHDWGTNYPNGGAGILYSRGWVGEFFRRNLSFERIHAGNYRYTYDVATGLLLLNYFERSIWIEHPWFFVVSPEESEMKVLARKEWRRLDDCPEKFRMVDLRDLVQWHISPFSEESVGIVRDHEFAPLEVKAWRPTAYRIRFCWSSQEGRSIQFSAQSLKKLEVNRTSINAKDVERRLEKFGSALPW